MYLNKMNVEHKGIIIIHTFPIRNNNKLQTT